MAVSRQGLAAGQQSAQPTRTMGQSASLAELVGEILDKGIVIDAWVRVTVLGLELLTIEARIVVASVATYLHYAEAVGLAPLAASPHGQPVTSGGENGHHAGGQAPSDDEVLRYLFEHPEGLQLGELQVHFNTPRQQLADVMNHLVEENKVRRHEEHKLYLPVRREGDYNLYLPEGR